MLKYSLVGYDSSDSSQRAFRFAMDLARCGGAGFAWFPYCKSRRAEPMPAA